MGYETLKILIWIILSSIELSKHDKSFLLRLYYSQEKKYLTLHTFKLNIKLIFKKSGGQFLKKNEKNHVFNHILFFILKMSHQFLMKILHHVTVAFLSVFHFFE
jgi:hypothetical protein